MRVNRGLIYLLIWGGYTSLCLGAGMWAESIAKNADIARLKTDAANHARSASEAALVRLHGAQQRGDELTNRLAKADADRQSLALEHSREIKRLSTGRACLNAGTVRLLNQSGPRSDAAAVPTSAGQPAAADAAAASDTDVAEWADHARRQYDSCRDRIQALIDWHQEKKP